MLLAFCLLFYSFSSSQLVWAETTTSPDIVVTEDDVVLENSSCPEGQDSSYIMGHPDGSAMIGFGKCVSTFAVTLAINEALTASGVSIDAINYSWRYANGCFNTSGGSAGYDQWCLENIEDRVDTTTGEILDGEYADQFDVLTVKVTVTDANGDIIEERTYTYDTWFDFENSNSYSEEEFYEEDMGFYWQVQRDSIRFWNGMTGEGTIYSPDQLGNITFRAQSVDGAYWEGGAYGPLVTAGTLNFTYRPNPCANNTLFDPSCPGYAEAYAQQEYDNNCSADPLYDPGCDGYQAAYEQQQYDNACYNDPLYDAGCPGYSEAYYDQQCSADVFYDSGCPGYQEAYEQQQYEQQCQANPLYDSGCDGYAEAYAQYEYEQQCLANPLYDSGCPGYETAYFNYQCEQNPLYDQSCPGYDEAYFAYQCEANPLYDSQCPGYETAYYNQQCELDPLYAETCPGYEQAYLTQQCNIDQLYDMSCPLYEETYFAQQCELDALYSPQCDGYEAAYAQQQFDLQCSLDALYDPLCSGYADALAEQQAQEQSQDVVDDPVINTITPEPVEVIVIVQEPVVEPVVVEQPVIEIEFDADIDEPEVTTETVVEDIIEDIDTTEEQNTNEEVRQEETQEEDGETSQENVESTSGTEEEESGEVETEDNPQDTGTQTRQLTPAQKKAAKEKKIKELIVKRLKNLAKEMGEAKSLEAQRDVQNYIIALLGFKVGFDAYRTEIPENYYYDDRDLNQDKKVPENNRGLRNGLAQEILHEKMVDEQYKDMD